MRRLADPGDRKGSDLVAYRIGNLIAAVLMAAVVALPVAWWLAQVLR
jgi:hypothetical protein